MSVQARSQGRSLTQCQAAQKESFQFASKQLRKQDFSKIVA